jgi:hypothetical protein
MLKIHLGKLTSVTEVLKQHTYITVLGYLTSFNDCQFFVCLCRFYLQGRGLTHLLGRWRQNAAAKRWYYQVADSSEIRRYPST